MGVTRRLAVTVGALAGLGLATMAGVVGAREYHLSHGRDWRGDDMARTVILVLGGGPTGGACSLIPDYRLARGFALAEEMPRATLLYSENFGGIAPLARAHLTRQAALMGYPLPARVEVEPNAVSTFENARLSAPIVGGRRVILVSDAFHLARARTLWRYMTGRWPDFAVAGEDEPDRVRLAKLMAREAAAWWFNAAKVAGWEILGLAGVPKDQREEIIR